MQYSIKDMNKKKKIIVSFTILVVISFQISPGKANVRMENESTILADKSFQFVFIGLNESQWYVVVFTNHSATLLNETFLSSGFKYKFDRMIPADNDNFLFVKIYQSDSSGNNVSSVLYTRQFNLVSSEDLNGLEFILSNLEFAIPILIIAIFTGVFIREAMKRRTK